MEQAMQKAVGLLEALAVKLGVTAQYLWPLLVRAEFTRTIGEIAAVVVWMGAAAVLFAHGWRKWTTFMEEGEANHDPYIGDDKAARVAAWLVPSGIMLAIGATVIMSKAGDTLARLASPEAAAFYRLLGK